MGTATEHGNADEGLAAALIFGQAVSELTLQAVAAPVQLQVFGHFSSGIYLRRRGDIFALANDSIPAGPLHLIVDRPVCIEPSTTEASLSTNRLTIGDFVVRLDGAAQWNPVLPSTEMVPTLLRHLRRELADHRPPPTELTTVWPEVARSLAVGDHQAMTALLEGRGSGLTPTGDDVLAGWMMVDALQHPLTNHELRQSLARSIRSTDLSRAFLRFAARGQCIEPLHRLFAEAATAEAAGLQAAAADLATIGASSGRAMLAGVMLAVHFPM